MRLDHLLSKEEVGVGLLLICQGQMKKMCVSAPRERSSLGRGHAAYTSDERPAKVSELPLQNFHQMCTYKNIAELLVAMRLWGTPVPIPNTTVKT